MSIDHILTWFPLVQRRRPRATNLEHRVHQLVDLITNPNDTVIDLSAAGQVYNRAALIASDIGDAPQAKQWCQDHYRAYLPYLPLSAEMAQRMLEPVVNLARLAIRAGNGAGAFQYLDQLYAAVRHKTPTDIDNITVPADPTRRQRTGSPCHPDMVVDHPPGRRLASAHCNGDMGPRRRLRSTTPLSG